MSLMRVTGFFSDKIDSNTLPGISKRIPLYFSKSVNWVFVALMLNTSCLVSCRNTAVALALRAWLLILQTVSRTDVNSSCAFRRAAVSTSASARWLCLWISRMASRRFVISLNTSTIPAAVPFPSWMMVISASTGVVLPYFDRSNPSNLVSAFFWFKDLLTPKTSTLSCDDSSMSAKTS